MYDATDRYIRQCLKNWAAQQQPPERVKADLLKTAVLGKVHQDKNLSRFDKDGHYVPLASSRAPVERAIEPLHQPKVWLLRNTLIPFYQVT
jgi:hypothetical protein